ncbi:hypothetical protein [Tuwongella immobilis]|uniref:Uncharacterized protein n=1 Tax=Tuwongella immobilis TaxID=692036 RepID=A0A6C2YXD6_9BACT|nr:hypothetical protein [Tuwongella immobilis]VIP05455.1 Uncharacterized protein OS=Hymenobacter sp. APR13 GN=N008_08520 PE=4 SV=1 [Tuwongella immobilis]VTS08266.1 Uncharacterized protein OS=Hymenobacter sp. APR13 GN=N008_08520 PE=4 SV=1 [Tuwongella immobilis]
MNSPRRNWRDDLHYWLGWPLRWLYQMAHNGHGIVRVLDMTQFRRMPAGLVTMDHPWVTGLNPVTGQPIWYDNVIFRTARRSSRKHLPSDDTIVAKTGQFLADRVAQSAMVPELPLGPQRRMPHGINYIHGSSHYNSGILIFNDFTEALQHVTNPEFRRELIRFVKRERREVLFLFRERAYSPREYAYFAGAMRTLFPWFCNSNGPRGRVLWGNAAPFPAANLITGAWIRDVYALKHPQTAASVVRPAIAPGQYFQAMEYAPGRSHYRFPEKWLAWATYLRVRMRGAKGGMFFVDRRQVYAEQLARKRELGLPDEPLARIESAT